MFNIFKKEAKESNKNEYPIIVQEIHNEFNVAGEILLKESLAILGDCNNRDKEKGKLLNKIGFKNTPQALQVQEIERKQSIAKANAELVNYYSREYPLNKFITESVVEIICKKYNLVCGDVSLYKGFVPNDKLKQIENFVIKEQDKIDLYYSVSSNHSKDITGSIDDSDLSEYGKRVLKHSMLQYFYITSSDGKHSRKDLLVSESCYSKYVGNPFVVANRKVQSLQICAPLKDMDTTGMKLHGYRLEKHIPDPIVLQPVRGGFLIISQWGDEASDELIVNNINN